MRSWGWFSEGRERQRETEKTDYPKDTCLDLASRTEPSRLRMSQVHQGLPLALLRDIGPICPCSCIQDNQPQQGSGSICVHMVWERVTGSTHLVHTDIAFVTEDHLVAILAFRGAAHVTDNILVVLDA